MKKINARNASLKTTLGFRCEQRNYKANDKVFMSTNKYITSRTKDPASGILRGESLEKQFVSERGNSCLQRKKHQLLLQHTSNNTVSLGT